jgi:hypothetical protein
LVSDGETSEYEKFLRVHFCLNLDVWAFLTGPTPKSAVIFAQSEIAFVRKHHPALVCFLFQFFLRELESRLPLFLREVKRSNRILKRKVETCPTVPNHLVADSHELR